MRLRASLAAVVVLVLVVVVAPEATGGGGTPITSCGQTLTTSAVLTQNLNCTGSGVIVGASGITIDLKGFTLRGDGSGSHHGIDTQMGGFDGLTVKNGAIVNFNHGIDARGDSDNVSVSQVLISGNDTGIWLEGDFAKIQSVTASGNDYHGIRIAGDAGLLKANTTNDNGSPGGTSDGGGSGIYVPLFTIPPVGTNNTALGNDDPAECSPTYLC